MKSPCLLLYLMEPLIRSDKLSVWGVTTCRCPRACQELADVLTMARWKGFVGSYALVYLNKQILQVRIDDGVNEKAVLAFQ